MCGQVTGSTPALLVSGDADPEIKERHLFNVRQGYRGAPHMDSDNVFGWFGFKGDPEPVYPELLLKLEWVVVFSVIAPDAIESPFDDQRR